MSTKDRIVRAARAKKVQTSDAVNVVKAKNKSQATTFTHAHAGGRKMRGTKVVRVIQIDNVRGVKARQVRAPLAANAQTPALGDPKSLDSVAAQLLALIPGLSRQQAQHLIRDLVNTRLSVQALGPALTKLDTAATPSTARALQATENVWREVEERYKLLTSTEVAALLGAKNANRAYASNLRAKGQLLGVQRRNSYVYPGFQFNARTHRIKPAIPLLLALAEELTWNVEDLTIWLSSPSGYYGGGRPADNLDATEEILTRARDEATVQW
ncbi:hypothetical protein E3O25_02630 [Cryobacterium sp. TMT1-3]|uniref:Uncharacterized protein n=1 Tax=Cryobacterium luteum TaxID=1424661 RepID=A0A1H8IJP9_9MICO|nr:MULTISPECIES: hypothetical protein [Cryobacterium]TFB95490.1 hypothetical protein E3O10_00080 [Cryobacterium luteum]TFC31360.1 hypothetical protein E3O25_02630 [Cryobacterium sp. TMT1-3]SEN68522.1 hypothetical protein SAMN05216281_111112 [Cryobacterium luteum]